MWSGFSNLVYFSCFAVPFFPAFREMIKKSYKIEAFLRANFKDDQTILIKRAKVGCGVGIGKVAADDVINLSI